MDLPAHRPSRRTTPPAWATQDPRLRRLLRARDRIEAAAHDDRPVQRLARIAGVSPAHFARAFKRASGVPPHRYPLSCHIERAAALLREADLPVTDTAFREGWHSLGRFGRTFHDITGESPGECRAREQAAVSQLDRVPACYLAAGRRPALVTAVSEKRRRTAAASIPASTTTEAT